MASKVVLKIFDNETVDTSSGSVEREIDTAAFDSGILYVEAAFSNTQSLDWEFREIHPADGSAIASVPNIPATPTLAPGARTRLRVSDLAGMRHQLQVVASTTDLTLTATLVGVVSA